MKEGKSMADAAKVCKAKIKKDLDLDVPEEISGEKPGDGSGEDLSGQRPSEGVDLADAEKVYDKYLQAGKLVPAQKEAFIKLYCSRKVLELGDNKVEFTKTFEQFMDSQLKIVNFEENGTQGDDIEKQKEKEKEKDNEGAMPEDVKVFFGKMGLSEDGIEQSWKYTQELQKQEKEEKDSTIFN